MTKPKIDVFSEGKTEKNISEQLARHGVLTEEFEERGGGGEKTMMTNFRLRLREWVKLQTDQRTSLRILLLRDLDMHEGKTIEDVCKSTINIVCHHDSTAKLASHPTHENVFVLKTEMEGLHLALHIASKRYMDSFVKATIDDYVLRLAVLEKTVKALLQQNRESGEKQNPKRTWEIEEVAFINKVLVEIPALLSANKIPPLMEAKDYIQFYATLLQAHSSPATFAGKALSHADVQDIREVFASLLSTIQLLS